MGTVYYKFAYGEPASPSMAREAVSTFPGLTCVEMSLDQQRNFQDNSLLVSRIVLKPEEQSPANVPSIGGLPLKIDESMPKDEIRFYDSDGLKYVIRELKV